MKYAIYIRTGRPKRKKEIHEGLEKKYITDGPIAKFEIEEKTDLEFWRNIVRRLIREKRPKFKNGAVYYLHYYLKKARRGRARIKPLGRIFVSR